MKTRVFNVYHDSKRPYESIASQTGFTLEDKASQQLWLALQYARLLTTNNIKEAPAKGNGSLLPLEIKRIQEEIGDIARLCPDNTSLLYEKLKMAYECLDETREMLLLLM
jgi:hypothetical protein